MMEIVPGHFIEYSLLIGLTFFLLLAVIVLGLCVSFFVGPAILGIVRLWKKLWMEN